MWGFCCNYEQHEHGDRGGDEGDGMALDSEFQACLHSQSFNERAQEGVDSL